MSSNIGYLYYKEYYKQYFTDKFIEECKPQGKKYDGENNPVITINQKILHNSNIDMLKNNKFKFIKKIQDKVYNEKIYFKTTYPGLIVGTGYSHILKEKEEFKLGLEFDYTTGLPVINGSSIKGVLRSVFYNKKDKEEVANEKETYIKDILKALMEKKDNNFNEEKFNFKNLTYNIFEGKYKEKGEIYKSMPINKRDIFFGATIDIEKTLQETTKAGQSKLLGEDYITPHGEGKDKLKNPKPIKFLKVMPNVVWCFGFNLNEFDKEITVDIKKELFKQILLDLGIGAKTNVGYGKLEVIDD